MSSAAENSPVPVMELANAAVVSLPSPEFIAIEDVTWTVRAGEYWVIGGPPGVGKSDLLATAAGLLRPASGSQRLFGQDVRGLREEERVQLQLRIGLVFGGGGRLFSDMTVAENLNLPLCYHTNCSPGAGDERVQRLLEALELTHVQHNTPRSIDRGLQERTALARALVLNPELLFLDNPLAGTGIRELRWWLKFLDALREGHPVLEGRRITVVVGTSNLEHWLEHASEFAAVQGGRFVVMGGRAELRRQSDPMLRELLPLDWLSE